MNLMAMTIPDDAAALVGWLERHLAGLDLATLVAELAVVHGNEAGPPLATILGDRGDAVLGQGLGVLPPAALKQLLRHPLRLLELQERILVEGGPFWERLAEQEPELSEAARRGGQRLSAALEAPATVPLRPRRFRWRGPVLASLASAASVAFIAYLCREPLARFVVGPPPVEQPPVVVKVPVEPPGWGWEKLAAPSPGTSASVYLNQLADAAAEWFRKRPEDAADLARRIGEMRQGCSRLLLAGHVPLTDPDERAWLQRKCRTWAASFDKSLRELEAGRPVGEVRREMDTVVTKVVAILRERADLLNG